jgi:hypothetical protein
MLASCLVGQLLIDLYDDNFGAAIVVEINLPNLLS